jgi:hypothetical protein
VSGFGATHNCISTKYFKFSTVLKPRKKKKAFPKIDVIQVYVFAPNGSFILLLFAQSFSEVVPYYNTKQIQLYWGKNVISKLLTRTEKPLAATLGANWLLALYYVAGRVTPRVAVKKKAECYLQTLLVEWHQPLECVAPE